MPVRDLLMGAVNAPPATYIEDVFSTYLYTGTGAAQSINNGIDLSGKGGLVWIKSRLNANFNVLEDTVRGTGNWLSSNSTASQGVTTDTVTSFNSNGFSLGIDQTIGDVNFSSAYKYASWTFAKQPQFFDVVTYTGDGTGSHTIAHNLGSTPAMIIVKSTTTATFGDWNVWHKNLPAQSYSLFLNTTSAAFNSGIFISQNSTSFTIGYGRNNESGVTFVAYLFASNAGGFGATGTDNAITCGSYTGTGSSNISINLGYEPQYILIKNSSSSSSYWYVQDVMRGMSYTSSNILYPNRSDPESVAASSIFIPTATGFNTSSSAGFNVSGNNYIYMAIRRPMKVPTDATTVFSPVYQAGGGTVTTNFPVDLNINAAPGLTTSRYDSDRLRGSNVYLVPNTTAAEANAGGAFVDFASNIGITDDNWGSGNNIVYWNFRRASGFFDVVCYTGTGTYTGSINHNLTVTPEFCIFRDRGTTANWWCYHSGLPYPQSQGMILNSTSALVDYYPTSVWGGTNTTFTTTNAFGTNVSGDNYVAYLFATCAGVSKVGSYTGNGTTQAIACGFTGGARFVLIKRTDSTGDWYTYDTARGMTTLIDPYLLLNSTSAQTATLGSVTTTTGGFTLNASILTAINTSGASYIFLAIA